MNQFHTDHSKIDGKDGKCKCCRTTISNKWRHNNRDRTAIYDKKRKYGLTPEREAEILEEQNGVCALCEKPKKLVVDHCHTTGIVRGLLCRTCNTGLGSFSDNLKGILKAVVYLERSVSADND